MRNGNQKESGREQDSCRTRNQDFVAPAPYHMPIEVVSVRVREHQHRERTPSRVVFGTGSGREAVVIVRRNERMKEFEGGRRPTTGCSGTKGEMIRQDIQESEGIMRTDLSICSIGNERLILLFNSLNLRGRLPFRSGIVQFSKRDLEEPESTYTQSNREILKAVDNKSKKFDKNRTAV